MLPNLSFENEIFPDRKSLKKTLSEDNVLYNDIVEQAKSLDLGKVKFDDEDFKPRTEIKQKQKVYFWVRVYLKEEIQINPDTDVNIIWKPNDEKIVSKFICFAKKGLDKDLEDQVVNYSEEDDRRVLCLMVDEERINIHNSDIPFLKTLFKIGRFYQNQVFRKEDLVVTDNNGNELDYFDIDF
jgi:hypothetical protein